MMTWIRIQAMPTIDNYNAAITFSRVDDETCNPDSLHVLAAALSKVRLLIGQMYHRH